MNVVADTNVIISAIFWPGRKVAPVSGAVGETAV